MFKKVILGALFTCISFSNQSFAAASKHTVPFQTSQKCYICLALTAVVTYGCYVYSDPLLEFGSQGLHCCSECTKPCVENCTECMQQIPAGCRVCGELIGACAEGLGTLIQAIPRCVKDCGQCCDDCAKVFLFLGPRDGRGTGRH